MWTSANDDLVGDAEKPCWRSQIRENMGTCDRTIGKKRRKQDIVKVQCGYLQLWKPKDFANNRDEHWTPSRRTGLRMCARKAAWDLAKIFTCSRMRAKLRLFFYCSQGNAGTGSDCTGTTVTHNTPTRTTGKTKIKIKKKQTFKNIEENRKKEKKKKKRCASFSGVQKKISQPTNTQPTNQHTTHQPTHLPTHQPSHNQPFHTQPANQPDQNNQPNNHNKHSMKFVIAI